MEKWSKSHSLIIIILSRKQMLEYIFQFHKENEDRSEESMVDLKDQMSRVHFSMYETSILD